MKLQKKVYIEDSKWGILSVRVKLKVIVQISNAEFQPRI